MALKYYSSIRAVWREAFVLDEAKLKPFSIVCSRHFVNGDSRCGPLLVPALLTPVAIAEEDILAAVLPTLAPIVGPSTTVVAIEGGPDWTTVDVKLFEEQSASLHARIEALEEKVEMLKKMKTLIEAGANIDQADKDGWTPLGVASYSGHIEIVKRIIEAGANVNHISKKGSCSLGTACNMGHLDVVKALLEAGANINQADKVSCSRFSPVYVMVPCTLEWQDFSTLPKVIINSAVDGPRGPHAVATNGLRGLIMGGPSIVGHDTALHSIYNGDAAANPSIIVEHTASDPGSGATSKANPSIHAESTPTVDLPSTVVKSGPPSVATTVVEGPTIGANVGSTAAKTSSSAIATGVRSAASDPGSGAATKANPSIIGAESTPTVDLPSTVVKSGPPSISTTVVEGPTIGANVGSTATKTSSSAITTGVRSAECK
eukprot:Em0024g410a